MRILTILILSCCIFSACAAPQESKAPQSPSGIVKKPESKENKELKRGDKVNMMLLMGTEDITDEMEDVIVIPPKDIKKKGSSTE